MPGATALHMRVSLKAVGRKEVNLRGDALTVCLAGGCFGSGFCGDIAMRDIPWIVIRKVNCRDVWEIRSRPRWLMRLEVETSRIYPNGDRSGVDGRISTVADVEKAVHIRQLDRATLSPESQKPSQNTHNRPVIGKSQAPCPVGRPPPERSSHQGKQPN